ncbi:hypothetical protein HGQ17_13185 [Nesterenkonia sp. MY13]|uniref:HNH endonuclease n=1 Tax=Nesterenkonia sedimenti TaxID=1463632 RepID=A0A7X8YET3_9MICC|nr:DUF1524 domain-containing protein [Nesterenkonia sedimenti]NLS10929.1 hypothetical protein [Nesterenkonia sedimenti]
MARGRRRALSAALAAALLLGGFTAPGAQAYSSPDQVPNPFQEYTAQDYADALWNLETTTYIRSLDRETEGDCEVYTYTVEHPLETESTRTYVHISDEDGWWCSGSDGDDLREEFDEKDEEDSSFYHGRPYENVNQRVPYYGTWADVNGNGVNSRTEIHARDLGNSSFTVSGTYYDHYSGQRVNIGDTETHGEHMIPVGHTWPEMQHRPREDRVAYYNDPMNLTTTIGWINREKGGHTPTEWMPSNEEAHCAYGMTWIHIANKHEVSLFSRDIDYLRDLLMDCLDEAIGSGGSLDGQRSSDLDWQDLPPAGADEISEESGGGPREHYSPQDYADAIWNLENHVRIRSVEREEEGDCDVQTFSVTPPRGGITTTYARVISPDNDYCSGDDGDELREELDEQAEEDYFHHGSPLAGKRRDFFGYWQMGEELNTRHEVLARDLREVEWNSTESGVRGGSFHDPYTGDSEPYSGAGTVIDHILPVEHAWIEFEHRSEEDREAFYNDPTNLLATTEESAEDKGADAPRNWMPEHTDFHCRYAMAWTHTAVKHEISLFISDIRQLRQTLYTCLSEESEGADTLSDTRRSELDWASLPPG